MLVTQPDTSNQPLGLQPPFGHNGWWKLLKSVLQYEKTGRLTQTVYKVISHKQKQYSWTRCSGCSGSTWCLRAPTSEVRFYSLTLMLDTGRWDERPRNAGFAVERRFLSRTSTSPRETMHHSRKGVGSFFTSSMCHLVQSFEHNACQQTLGRLVLLSSAVLLDNRCALVALQMAGRLHNS